MSASPSSTTGMARMIGLGSRSPNRAKVTSGTITTWLLAISVARPAPIISIDECHATTSALRSAPASIARSRSLTGLSSLVLPHSQRMASGGRA